MNIENKIILTTGTCGIAAGALDLINTFDKDFIKITGCMGLCFLEPMAVLQYEDTFYLLKKLKKEDTPFVMNLFKKGILANEIKDKVYFKGSYNEFINEVFSGQRRKTLRNIGWIDPLNIEDYIKSGGYEILKKCLTGDISKEKLLSYLKDSGLRGRGGAGFPTYKKWEMLKSKNFDKKYIVCNGDEGDPGAFMDRSLMEGDPHSVLEGLLIGAYVTGATNCIIYLRAEYPLALKTIRKAIIDLKDRFKLNVDISIFEGAGAFVCGEETALINSIEGKRGMPKIRPPYPIDSGIFGNPTCINNVETLSIIPWIMKNPNEYEKLGYKNSRGTKVFSIAGKVDKGGLFEVEFGKTLRDVIDKVVDFNKVKAAQIGGPSGGCLSKDLLNTKIDYEELSKTGAILGSGGMVVIDKNACMIDMAKFFMEFNSKESCGKCTFCRVGTKKILELLVDFSKGVASLEDLQKLEELSIAVSKLSLCGLGKTSPNPVLTTIKYFKNEYLEHIEGKCKSHVCKELLKYKILSSCVKCKACMKKCPVNAISSDFIIDQNKCVKCGVCFEVCKFSSVSKE